MSKSLTVQVPDDLWTAMQEVARKEGRTPEAIALEWLVGQAPKGRTKLAAQEAATARSRFRRHFGAVKSGNTQSADNEQIDADLAREYASTHEVKS